MITELLGALRALPQIAAALKELGAGIKEANASRRKEEKQDLVDDLITSARERRLRKQEAKRVSGDSGEESGRDGASDSDTGGH